MVKKKKAKKKAKKVKKVKKKKPARKKTKSKKPARLASRARGKSKGKAVKKEKTLAVVDHYFGNISVAAFRLKAPLKVGDYIHIKGHTTDFVQKIDSIQSNHKKIAKAGKGTEVGIKVKSKVRVGDVIYLEPKGETVLGQAIKPMGFQQPMFPRTVNARPQLPAPQKKAMPPQIRKKPGESGPYSGKKFLSF